MLTEMLATRREKGFELTPRLIFILQLVALRGYITEVIARDVHVRCLRRSLQASPFSRDNPVSLVCQGSIEDHIEMCEATLRDICAMSVPVLDAETQIQLRKQVRTLAHCTQSNGLGFMTRRAGGRVGGVICRF
jgi:hypothetical protein